MGRRRHHWPSRLLGFVAAAFSLSALGTADAQDAIPAVDVVRVEARDVTPKAEFVGRVEAVQRVELMARVTGYLEQQLFEDGQQVDADDLLFVVEQAPFAATVRQAEADLKAAEADFENAAVQLARAEELVLNDNIPQATVDERRSTALMAEAAILQAEAALEQAEITLSYTEIHTPISGRVGRANVKVGNLVNPASGVLATVVQDDPAFVSFTVAERDVLSFRREQQAQGRDWRGAEVQLQLQLGDGSTYEHDGVLDFVDVQVNPTTDTITLRGTFPNPDGFLFDQQFVVVSAFRQEPVTALLVPVATVQVDQQGSFVLVVDESDQVAVRRVVPGVQVGREVIIDEGLAEGDRVIVGGLMKVRPGMQVQPVAAEQPGA